jgi:hypothetical protein
VKADNVRTQLLASARSAVVLVAGTTACVVCLCIALTSAPAAAVPAHARAATHFACTGPATVPCHFATPSGNIRCLWTPKPNNVACERVAVRRGYRLRPSGHAHAIHLNLKRRGETLPTNQQVVFPDSLSCHDTKTTMTCNQDFGFGEFKLAPKGSHGS